MLSINGVNKFYGDTKVLDNIEFEVEKGSIFAILGHNGAGKSTLINCIMNLTKYEGEIKYPFDKNHLYKKVGLQMQSSSFEEGAKVKEICQLYKNILKTDVNIEALLKEFDLIEFKNNNVTKLSGGEKQKLSILLTLIGKPEIIIFDEITTGLDVIARRKIWSIIKKINSEREITVILTSHFLEEIEYLADYVLIIEKGTKKIEGSVKEIINNTFGQKKIVSFTLDDINVKELSEEFNISNLGEGRYTIEFSPVNEAYVLKELSILGAEDILMKNHTFEDAFLKNLGYVIDQKGETLYV
ncbi:ABC transporter ATP-binding protein [Lentibacillus sp. CBA3610]|uniref:ABC transporter ATP-binding protein n=1 Tax=Lentibacillus sp. CBA3610 TaxID=2518176 RepID=UPI001595D922|nr:ABC transporter ATP-binding protein [Lentibacillus sp. CBA3610]QKY71293.1 ABC transporter ATP-binding protein [Lentibacillus sp. CBA3610]